jgi:hypothetical protein
LRQLQIGRRYTEPPPIIPSPIAGVGRLRKIAIVGAAHTVDFTPWYDASWEIWAHSTTYPLCKRVDRYFDLHPWKWIVEKPMPGYVDWLTSVRTPVYMQRKFPAVRSSVRYPRERVLTEFRRYFTSQAAWMMALALTEGVTHLGFFGIHYSLDEEHKKQRAGCEYWMGVCEGRGVQLVLPPGSPLLREPNWLYGYESHDGKQHARTKTGGEKPFVPPPQNRRIDEFHAPTVDHVVAATRDDIPKRDLDRLAAQLAGHGPLKADGTARW